MKVELTVKKEFEVKYLNVSVGVRYWEDATVNGVDDVDCKIPCVNGDRWEPIIEVDSGKIANWTQGVTAEIHYKICDDGTYTLIDGHGLKIISKDGYVPDIMCPDGNGYGDYIIMKVDENGVIENWNADFSDFQEEE